MNRVRLYMLSMVFFLAVGFSAEVSGQCSMCRQVAESNLKQGDNKRGRGLNTAILYLMSVPYLLGGVGGYILWRNRKKDSA